MTLRILLQPDPVEYSGVLSTYLGVDLDSGEQVRVHELSRYLHGDSHAVELFQHGIYIRNQLAQTPVPRVLHIFGRNGQPTAIVEPRLPSVPLSTVLAALQNSGTGMRPEIALAIVAALAPVWSIANTAEPPIQLVLAPSGIYLGTKGAVQAIPEYRVERMQQEVGAAINVIDAEWLNYVAPEHLVGEPSDERSTIFAVGLMLYEMIAGAHPLQEMTSTFERLAFIAAHDLPPIEQRSPKLPKTLTVFINRSLRRTPDSRFSSWSAYTSALRAVRATLPSAGPPEIAAMVEQHTPAELKPEPTTWRSFPPLDYTELPRPTHGLNWTPVSTATQPVKEFDADVVYPGSDGRPMYRLGLNLMVDARLVTAAEYERFCVSTSTPRPPQWSDYAERGDVPATTLSASEAQAYAHWAGKRLPSEQEWDAAIVAFGAQCLGGEGLWEWTATPHPKGGHVVRGGRWRNRVMTEPDPSHRSFETGSAPDVGFRCVVNIE